MERPTKITVIKKNDGYEIICMDEMSGSSIGMDMPTNGYLALAEHFRTCAMEVSSDELSGLHKHFVNASFSSKEELRTFIQMHLPIAIRPTKPAKTMFVSPFTSHNSEKVVVDSLVESFLNGVR